MCYRHTIIMQTKQQQNASKSGFTLIEVIAVLVILAVLAAVAIPRYISLIDDARDQALNGAVAAGLSHASLAYGRLALQTGQAPTAAAVATEATTTGATLSDDYGFTFVPAGVGVDVEATEKNKPPAKSLKKTWTLP